MTKQEEDYKYVEHGTVNYADLPPLDAGTKEIMGDELRTGVSLTIFYFILIFSIPVMNWYFPAIAFKPVWGGMTFTWLVTSIIMMGMAFIIAYVHTKLYEKRLAKYDHD